MPMFIVPAPKGGVRDDIEGRAMPTARSLPSRNGALHVPSPAPSREPSPVSFADPEDELGGMWRGINGRGANMSKTEKVLNKVSDAASATIS
jgi:hypothetical protein